MHKDFRPIATNSGTRYTESANTEADLELVTALAGLIATLLSRPWRWADQELRDYSALAAAALGGLLLTMVV
jgi:hypothetical protein